MISQANTKPYWPAEHSGSWVRKKCSECGWTVWLPEQEGVCGYCQEGFRRSDLRRPATIPVPRLAEVRERAGLTQKMLRQEVRVSDSQLRRYEQGSTDPTGATALALAEALCVSVDDLGGVLR